MLQDEYVRVMLVVGETDYAGHKAEALRGDEAVVAGFCLRSLVLRDLAAFQLQGGKSHGLMSKMGVLCIICWNSSGSVIWSKSEYRPHGITSKPRAAELPQQLFC